ncbi:DM4/DM12 family domain-containing protein [Phthorimaea operculella]|nr:DM4/DM12 family domain-containing protein [Phthorimaea operculella]
MITNRQGLFIVFVLALAYTTAETYRNTTLDLRAKRQVNSLPLVFPYGAVFKFVIGLSMPIPITDGIAVGYGANLQFQYQQIQNISELSQYYFIKTVAREERDLDVQHRADERLVFYKSVASLVDSRGINGNECMLRAICEAAQYPVEEEGLVGEIIHILLTPDYGKSPFEDAPDWDGPMAAYKDAATAGRQMFSCPAIYSKCPEGEDRDGPMAAYKDAATAGRQMLSCPAIYSGCPEGESFFELVSVLKDE